MKYKYRYNTFTSKKILQKLKTDGKKLFLWTIKKEDAIAKALRLPIDGIITDNPHMARYIIETKGLDSVVNELIKIL